MGHFPQSARSLAGGRQTPPSAAPGKSASVRASADRRVPPELRGSGAGGVAGIAEASVRSEHPAEGACGQSRRPGSMRYHPPRKMTTAPGRGCLKAPQAKAIRKRACGRVRRQGDSPPDRTCRPGDQTLHSSVEVVAHQNAPQRRETILVYVLAGDQRLRATEQSRHRPAQNSQRQKYPRGSPSPKQPYRRR